MKSRSFPTWLSIYFLIWAILKVNSDVTSPLIWRMVGVLNLRSMMNSWRLNCGRASKIDSLKNNRHYIYMLSSYAFTYLSPPHFIWFSMNLFFGIIMLRTFAKIINNGDIKMAIGKLRNCRRRKSRNFFIRWIHPHFASALFSFPRLPSRTSPIPKRKSNQEKMPPEVVEARHQIINPMTIKISPQIEQRTAAVLGP